VTAAVASIRGYCCAETSIPAVSASCSVEAASLLLHTLSLLLNYNVYCVCAAYAFSVWVMMLRGHRDFNIDQQSRRPRLLGMN
jgi:hypothetical protein